MLLDGSLRWTIKTIWDLWELVQQCEFNVFRVTSPHWSVFPSPPSPPSPPPPWTQGKTPGQTAGGAGAAAPNTHLLVSGIRESRAWGSLRPSPSQGAPSFSPLAWLGSGPEAGAALSLGGVPFPSAVSWAPSA